MKNYNKEENTSRLELLLFRLSNNQTYGINVFKVKEIIKCPKIIKIPKAASIVKGLITVREQTIPVIDLSFAIGFEELVSTDEDFVIITECNGSTNGFIVNSVDKIINLKWQEVDVPPKSLSNSHYITSIAKIDNNLIQIIDVEKIFSILSPPKEELSKESSNLKINQDEDEFVCIIDDSLVARNQIERLLAKLKINYKSFKNGEDFKNYLNESNEEYKKINVIISDIEMPKLDGYTLTSQLKNDAKYNKINILLHTSLNSIVNKDLAIKVGADDFLEKFNINELAKKVIKLINQK